jgi:hypothetical protein
MMSRSLRLSPVWLLPLLLAACARQASGTLELRMRWEGGVPGITSLEVDPDWAGASRHPHRDAGWHRLDLLQDRLSLEPGAPAIAVAKGRLEAGNYDRVLISSPLIQALDDEGRSLAVISHVEPIARSFELGAGGTVRIEISLTLRPGVATGSPLEAFVMHAEVLAPEAGKATG